MENNKKHTLSWFTNRIGKKVNRYKVRRYDYEYVDFGYKEEFTLTKENCKPFYLAQKDFNYRYKEII